MTKIIGLTGGIGSGKTTIGKHFKSHGIPVYIADDEAKKIAKSTKILKLIQQTFGNEVFDNAILNNSKLSKIVFENPEKLQQLNAIIHPAVREHFIKWKEKHKNSPYVIKEAAILFESGSYKDCDIIITVIAPLEDRIQRVMKRDNVPKVDVLKRINNQWTDNERITKSDFVINNTNLKIAKEEVDIILKKLTIL